MSEQAKILTEMHQLIMNILKNGSTTVEEADKMDELEALLHKQNSFKKSSNGDTLQGEEIATLFFNDKYSEAINKLCEYEISPSDFFGFIEYHYDDEHEDEELIEMFTNSFASGVFEDYQSTCTS